MTNFFTEKTIKGPVIGLDEVGRGPLAGPVVSCGCLFNSYESLPSNIQIKDSKKHTPKQRKKLFSLFKKLQKDKILEFHLGFASVKEIDELNILEATKLSMKRAVIKLNRPPLPLIIDGKIDLKLRNYPSHGIIKGDQKSLSIATASIIAKVHRDRYMQFLSYTFPYYNWSSNFGYGTKKHIEQICKKGITIHHRKSFEPIKSLIHNK